MTPRETRPTERTRPDSCGAVPQGFKGDDVACQLPTGHPLPHRYEDDDCIVRWHPRGIDARLSEVARLTPAGPLWTHVGAHDFDQHPDPRPRRSP